jgi:hypothetical protein
VTAPAQNGTSTARSPAALALPDLQDYCRPLRWLAAASAVEELQYRGELDFGGVAFLIVVCLRQTVIAKGEVVVVKGYILIRERQHTSAGNSVHRKFKPGRTSLPSYDVSRTRGRHDASQPLLLRAEFGQQVQIVFVAMRDIGAGEELIIG